MLIRIDSSGPIYRQIYSAIRSAILSGQLTAGAQIPSSRQMSKDLAVSRNAVMLAYDQLLAEGYIHSSVGSGTYVSANMPDEDLPRNRRSAASTGGRTKAYLSKAAIQAQIAHGQAVNPKGKSIRCDFQYGAPNIMDFPHELWRRLLISCARMRSAQAISYAPVAGAIELREAVADYLRRARAVVCEPENVLIVNGSQQALDLVARTLSEPGDRVVIENPHYSGARHVFSAVGAELVPVPVDRDGLIIDVGKQLTSDAKLIYVTPSHQFPTGGIMPLARRLELLSWAETTGAYVVEDDYDSEFRYVGRPIEAVQGLDRQGRVIYVGTLSKTMFPALRIGYLVLPTELIKPFTAMKYVCDRHTATLYQHALARFLSEGHFERHIRRARVRNAARREALITALRISLGERILIEGENSGLHLLVWFPELKTSEMPLLVQVAESAGLGIYPVTPYFIGDPPMAGFVLGYASLEETQIRGGVGLLKRALNEISTR